MGEGEGYLRSLEERFGVAAAAAGGVVERDLAIGRAHVRLRFAGDALLGQILPPMAHLVTPEAGALTLTLCIWDSASTGVDIPPFPWRPRDLRQRGEVAGYNDARLRTVYHGDITDPTLGFNAISMFDAESRSGIFWVESVERLPWFERAAPLRPLLHWGLHEESSHLVHAGAVANEDGGVLLGGSGGSGKSTSALACVEAGFKFVSDDYVLMVAGRRPIAHSVFCMAKIRPEGIRFHAWIRDLVTKVDRDGEEKYVFDLNRHMPERLALSAPIDALLLPRLSDGSSVTLRRVTPTQALLALAPSTIYQLPSSRRISLAPMSQLVRQVPTYALDLGGPPDQVPAAIANFLATAKRR